MYSARSHIDITRCRFPDSEIDGSTPVYGSPSPSQTPHLGLSVPRVARTEVSRSRPLPTCPRAYRKKDRGLPHSLASARKSNVVQSSGISLLGCPSHLCYTSVLTLPIPSGRATTVRLLRSPNRSVPASRFPVPSRGATRCEACRAPSMEPFSS
jgi:hypothetical protein